ncbi:hypothetical protein BRC67_02945 [Halobacteriales archaeon QH_3_68_24]|nr:MAG: hypothetical protein BRC67_02945 [Halobacteriales archaeon QH_3_68_24]
MSTSLMRRVMFSSASIRRQCRGECTEHTCIRSVEQRDHVIDVVSEAFCHLLCVRSKVVIAGGNRRTMEADSFLSGAPEEHLEKRRGFLGRYLLAGFSADALTKVAHSLDVVLDLADAGERLRKDELVYREHHRDEGDIPGHERTKSRRERIELLDCGKSDEFERCIRSEDDREQSPRDDRSIALE